MKIACPKCGNDYFYEGDVTHSIGEDAATPIVSIRPRKFKFSLKRGSYIDLPSECIACSNCGAIWSEIDPDELKKEIKEWLNSDKIKNTKESTCLSCKSNNALTWKLYLPSPYYFQYKGRDSYSIIFSWASAPEVNPECVVCLDCGVINYSTNPQALKKKAKNTMPSIIEDTYKTLNSQPSAAGTPQSDSPLRSVFKSDT